MRRHFCVDVCVRALGASESRARLRCWPPKPLSPRRSLPLGCPSPLAPLPSSLSLAVAMQLLLFCAPLLAGLANGAPAVVAENTSGAAVPCPARSADPDGGSDAAALFQTAPGPEPQLGCAVWESCYQGRCCGSGSCGKESAEGPMLGCGLWESCYQGRCCGSGSCGKSCTAEGGDPHQSGQHVACCAGLEQCPMQSGHDMCKASCK